MLAKFIERIEDIEVQKKGADIDEYMALHEEQQEEIKIVESRMKSGNGAADRADHAGKSKWSQQRKDYSKTNAKQNSTLKSWLKPLGGKRKDELEEISGGGTPTNPRDKSDSGRYLNLVHPDKPKSPRMNRKNINFMMSDDTSHRVKETKLKHREDQASKRQDPLWAL